MNCKYCNSPVEDGAEVCPKCGKRISGYSGAMRKTEQVISDRDDFYADDEAEKQTAEKEGKKSHKGIIAALIIILLAAAAVFGLYHFGIIGGNKGDDVEPSSTAPVNEGVTEEYVSEPTSEKTDKKTEYKKGFYKVTRSSGVALYESNEIKDKTPVHIFTKGETVEVKAFFFDGNTALGFITSGKYSGWIKLSDVEYVPENTVTTTKPDESTTKAPEETARVPETTTEAETTTKAPEVTTKAPETTTEAPEETTRARSTGNYVVSESVGDFLNVRGTAGPEAEIVGRVDIGKEVVVESWKGDWAKITVDGAEVGYVYGAYLEEN